MIFLHPLLLAGLALTALPVLIHLVNQLRYRTIRWGAMMFLLQANRMSRGLARLRQWLILLMRMLAIACLVFVISRPLASGWVGSLGGGHADTTIVVLDRSPSMADASAGRSKLAAARQQLADALGRLSSTRWLLIESATAKPREIESPAALIQLPETGPTSAAADLPAMLAAARDYITANQAGRTEIWICSDLHANDWNADDNRWADLRSSFAGLPQSAGFHLLAYAQPPQGDVAVRVTSVRHRKLGDGSELLLSLRLSRSAAGEPATVPVQFDIGGARSTLSVELFGTAVEVRDHRILLDAKHQRGWGKVSLPADSNLANNDYYFAFDAAQSAHTVIVSDEREVAESLALAASIAPEVGQLCSVEIVPSSDVTSLDWSKAALVLWQAPLPKDEPERQLAAFVDRGGQAIFLPPREPTADAVFGLSWKSWTALKDEAVVDRWRGDEDLLANTQSGAALSIGKLRVRKLCTLAGEATPLASLAGGETLLARAATPKGGVYFLSTIPAAADSNLASEGVVLYVAVQRALAAGAAALGTARQVVAHAGDQDSALTWQRLAGNETALSSEYAVQSGAYADGDVLLAVNRPEEEDVSSTLDDARVAGLFQGLDFTRIDQVASSERSPVEEIWRAFLIAMMIALVVEAWLCLPRPASQPAVAGRLQPS